MIKRIIQAIQYKIKGISNEQLTLEANLKAGLKVGKNCSGLINCTIDYGHCWLIEIGDDVIFAPQVYLLAHDTSTKRSLGYTKIAKIKIGNKCFIGARVLIMPGVTIGENSIIGAGSVVVKSIPANVVAAGNPARVITTLSDYESKLKQSFENSPQYDYSYTLGGLITEEKKNKVVTDLENQVGYVL
ncbi:acyltransferase [Flavobacterium sp. GSA192]|uniref:acyltransferase n=1 Tax=Flavobacterium sp. GSA192 TaxID=2576304 RepID=UPI0011290FB6|nr:DapH/DapD/GlmU-related protein [Flavobacterium sp. GSA192]